MESAQSIYESLINFGRGTQDIYNGCLYFSKHFNLNDVIDNQNNPECKNQFLLFFLHENYICNKIFFFFTH